MNGRQSQQKAARGKPDSAFKACQRLNRKKRKQQAAEKMPLFLIIFAVFGVSLCLILPLTSYN